MKPCTKVRHLTKREAKTALRTLKSSTEDKKKPIRVYFCKECNAYHLTSITLTAFKILDSKENKTIRSLHEEIKSLKEKLIEKDLTISNKDNLIKGLEQEIKNKQADLNGEYSYSVNQKTELQRLNKQVFDLIHDKKVNHYKAQITHRAKVEDMFFEGRPTLTKQWVRFHKLHPFKQEEEKIEE